MNYGELKTAIAGYLQRSDAAGVIPDFVESARLRLSDELRSGSNIVLATIPVVKGIGTLPSDCSQTSVAYTDDDWVVPIEVRRTKVITNRGLTEDITLAYFRFLPAFAADSDTVLVPDLFRSAALVEGFTYYHNADMAALHEQRYQQMLQRENKSYRTRWQPKRRVTGYNSYQGAL